MKTWVKQLERWPAEVVVLGCIVFITLVGYIDYATGYETFFFTFYLLAIFLGTWRVSVTFGVLLSALSVAAWVSANIEAGQRYSTYFVPVWNAGIMFTIYGIIVLLLGGLKHAQAGLEERVRLRTEELAREIRERMRLQRELLESSDREQRRLGRELHDGLCQHLTGTAMAGHLLERKLAAQLPAQKDEAGRLVHLIEEAIDLTRDLSYQLDPVDLKLGKLTDHLDDLAAGISERFHVSCRRIGEAARQPEDSAALTHLYRLAHAAALRAIKTSRAAQVRIQLDSSDQEVVLTVTDDGMVAADRMGNDLKAADSEYQALAYRAELIGAKLTIERLSPQGTRVTCRLPSAATEKVYAGKN